MSSEPKIKITIECTKQEFKTTPSARKPEAPFNITMNISKMKNELKGINK